MAYHNLNFMNSLLKTVPAKSLPLEDYLAQFEAQISAMNSLEEAELLFKKIKFLGIHFDPFSSDISAECQQIMNQLDLHLYLDNPYQMTNILLRLLDKTEEKINNLKH